MRLTGDWGPDALKNGALAVENGALAVDMAGFRPPGSPASRLLQAILQNLSSTPGARAVAALIHGRRVALSAGQEARIPLANGACVAEG